jgi:hypothetical protein
MLSTAYGSCHHGKDDGYSKPSIDESLPVVFDRSEKNQQLKKAADSLISMIRHGASGAVLEDIVIKSVNLVCGLPKRGARLGIPKIEKKFKAKLCKALRYLLERVFSAITHDNPIRAELKIMVKTAILGNIAVNSTDLLTIDEDNFMKIIEPPAMEGAIGPEILDFYRPGDLIYGLAKPRNAIAYMLRQEMTEEYRAKNPAEHISMVQHAFLDGDLDLDGQYTGELDLDLEEVASRIREDVIKHKVFLEQHPKYSPLLPENSKPKDYWLRIARGCKGAMERILKQEHKRIHFVLNGIDMEAVLDNKWVVTDKRSGDKSITAIELRWVYRNWGDPDVREGVYFYVDELKVKAPWETDPELWATYEPKKTAPWRERYDFPPAA